MGRTSDTNPLSSDRLKNIWEETAGPAGWPPALLGFEAEPVPVTHEATDRVPLLVR